MNQSVDCTESYDNSNEICKPSETEDVEVINENISIETLDKVYANNLTKEVEYKSEVDDLEFDKLQQNSIDIVEHINSGNSDSWFESSDKFQDPFKGYNLITFNIISINMV